MKLSIIVICLLSCINVFAQQLQFSEVGSEPAFCRLFNYQSGNGVVYAAATGGTPDYTYEWTNLATGVDVSNSVWGGLNPGEYQIKIWDSAGDSIIQVVMVDSVNPQASFDVVSAGLTPQGNDLYWGEAGVEVDFVNTSIGVSNLNDPNTDTTFFWRMTQFADWYVQYEYSTESFTYNYGGTWASSLVAINKNGCTDTAQAYIWLNGTASVSEGDSEFNSWYYDGAIHFNTTDKNDFQIEIVNVNGQLLQVKKLNYGTKSIAFNYQPGIYFIRLKDGQKTLTVDKVVVP